MDTTLRYRSSSLGKVIGRDNWLKRTRAELLAIGRIVGLYPSTVLYPLLVLGLVLAIGVWGVMYVAKSEESSSRDRAAILALDAAVWIHQQLTGAMAPVMLSAAMVSYAPRYDDIIPLFNGLAPVMLTQSPVDAIRVLQLVPNGRVASSYPLAGNEKAMGLDVFASDLNRAGAIRTVANKAITLVGPMDFFQGGYGVIVREPIFISGVDANETFGAPYPLNPICGRPCEYDITTRTKLWGFVAALVDLDALTRTEHSKLRSLENLGYLYEVEALGTVGNMSRLVAASATPPVDPVLSPIVLPNNEWVIRVSPDHGWSSKWYGGLMAGVVVLAVATATLLFLALVSRRRHQMLLEALLPKRIIQDLRGEDASSLYLCPKIQRAETPADLLLNMMGDLLEGYPPDLGDVVFIRTALVRNMDLYTPINVKNHIGGGNLDAEVAQALMQQLVGGRRASLSAGSRPDRSLVPDDTQAPPCAYNFDTISGALAFIVSPEALLRDPAVPPCGSGLGSGGEKGGSGGGGRGGQHSGPLGQRGSALSPYNALSFASFADVSGLGEEEQLDDVPNPQGSVRAATTVRTRSAAMMDDTAVVHSRRVAAAAAMAGKSLSGEVAAADVGASSCNGTSKLAAVARRFRGGGGGGGGGGSRPAREMALAASDKCLGSSNTRPNSRLALSPQGVVVRERERSLAGCLPQLPQLLMAPASPAAALLQTGGGADNGSPMGGDGTEAGLRTSTGRPPPPLFQEVERLLAGSDSWHFDTWALQEATGGHALSVMGFYLIQREGLMARFRLKPLMLARVLRHVEAGYLDNPYHNATHAADVLQNLHVLVHGAQLHVHYLDPLGLLAAYFSAIIHDYGHPGLTGDFLANTSDPLALRYNDRSPLENHHCAAVFSLMRRDELDLLAPLSQSDRTTFRKQVIDMVLATDMKQHFSILSHFSTVHRLAAYTQQQHQRQERHDRQEQQQHGGGGGAPGTANTPSRSAPTAGPAMALFDHQEVVVVVDGGAAASTPTSIDKPAPRPVDDTERLLSLQIALKCADIGNLGRELDCYKRWVDVLEEEFFLQGDRERALGIPISPLSDRTKQGVSKSQIGFYDFVALPLVHAMASAFPGAQPLMRAFLANYNYWRRQEADTSTESGCGTPQQLSGSKIPKLDAE